MKSNQIDEQDKIYDAFKGIDAIIELNRQYKDDFKRFFHLDLEKMENEILKIGRCSLILVTDEEDNSFKFGDLSGKIETLLEANDTIRKNFLNREFDEKDKKKYTQDLINHIIDKIKIKMEICIEGRLKL